MPVGPPLVWGPDLFSRGGRGKRERGLEGGDCDIGGQNSRDMAHTFASMCVS